jgi:hypothetical protein
VISKWSLIRCLLFPGGAIAQLGERLLCKQEVVGSIPSGSTKGLWDFGPARILMAAQMNAINPDESFADIAYRRMVRRTSKLVQT